MSALDVWYGKPVVIDFPREADQQRCLPATQFLAWCDELLDWVEATDDVCIRINQAKVLLVDRYFDWRAFIPGGQRDRCDHDGQECVLAIFNQTYARLRERELGLLPPETLPPPPPPPDPGPSSTELRRIATREVTEAIQQAAQEARRTMFFPEIDGPG